MADHLHLLHWISLTSFSSAASFWLFEDICSSYFKACNLTYIFKVLVPVTDFGSRVWISLGDNPANQKKSQAVDHIECLCLSLWKAQKMDGTSVMEPGWSMICSPASVWTPQWRPVHLPHLKLSQCLRRFKYAFQISFFYCSVFKIQFCFLSLSY
jgi:hypothetical protein